MFPDFVVPYEKKGLRRLVFHEKVESSRIAVASPHKPFLSKQGQNALKRDNYRSSRVGGKKIRVSLLLVKEIAVVAIKYVRVLLLKAHCCPRGNSLR